MTELTLNNGVKIPQLGFGVYLIPAEETEAAVYHAIKVGYRHIDTAILYNNEKEVGLAIKRAIADGLVTREELFVTSKLFPQHAEEAKAHAAIEGSLSVMGLDYLDLYLIHQPYGDVFGAWRALNDKQKAGKVRAIGVSNFYPAKLVEFCELNGLSVPQVNQIELNPWHQRQVDRAYHDKYDVKIEAWAPFAQGRHDLFTNATLQGIADTHGKSVGQVVLRWVIQQGVIALAKSVTPTRIEENLNIFDFELSDADMTTINELDKKESAFLDHQNPETVAWFMERIKGMMQTN